MKKTKQSPIQTDKTKRFCKYCGTYTVVARGWNSYIPRCTNINHSYYKLIKSI